MDCSWNPSQTLADLRQAQAILSQRGLKRAALWAAEQCVGLEDRDDWTHVNVESPTPLDASLYITNESSRVSLAQSLLDLGEYAHAASVLSQGRADDPLEMGPPLQDLSPAGLYFRAYALYMAGERIKEEDLVEGEG
jgi:Anaphase promoting complex subunit 8 / Cdc23